MTSFLNRRMRSVLLSKFTDRCQGLFEGEPGCDYASVVPLCQIGSFTGAAIPFPQHAWGREPCRTALQRSLDGKFSSPMQYRARVPSPQREPMGPCLDALSFDPACQCVLNLQYRTSPFLRARHPAPQIGCRRWEARRKTVGIERAASNIHWTVARGLMLAPREELSKPDGSLREFRGAWETPSAFY